MPGLNFGDQILRLQFGQRRQNVSVKESCSKRSLASGIDQFQREVLSCAASQVDFLSSRSQALEDERLVEFVASPLRNGQDSIFARRQSRELKFAIGIAVSAERRIVDQLRSKRPF